MALLQGRLPGLRAASLGHAGHAPRCRAARPPVLRRDRMQTRCDCTSTASSSGAAPEPQEGYDMRSRGDLRSLLRSKMQQTGTRAAAPGEVFLVGTGPGDPGLLTLRAVQLMQRADVVLYDRLVSEDILRLVNPAARMVYVGKQAGYHTATQAEIHQLLAEFAGEGGTVVRLKGGDPYVFGRGGEEVQYLAAAGIRAHAVPGITAAAGICAELGIPMTHRGVATSLRFLTGHTREGGEALLDAAVADSASPHTTLAVYMGLATLPALAAQLTGHGMAAGTPAVAVERGTTERQRVAYGTLCDLAPRAAALGLQSPALIILGEVVALSAGWQAWEAEGRPTREAATPPCPRTLLPDAAEAVLGLGGQEARGRHEAAAGAATAA